MLEYAWPAVLETAAEPLESVTWQVALGVSADPATMAAMSEQQFLAAVRERMCALGRKKPRRCIALAVPARRRSPHRVVSFISVVGCGHLAVQRDPANRRQVIESATSWHRLRNPAGNGTWWNINRR